ncbi:MAG: hypothetical protein ACRDBP_18350 [Luteolibacter sp.]
MKDDSSSQLQGVSVGAFPARCRPWSLVICVDADRDFGWISAHECFIAGG